ncbi:hypothetical protein Dda_8819 [Drechslerella dactyloides]|uniref:PCI domain-containing protein n=1 Tax=Drechslerella dactyloides TaxID=74499 RepID=A0AAD6ISU8_DREDA|nr:hypothetical protein Dda_8819 [Drechslerella dactyloides]
MRYRTAHAQQQVFRANALPNKIPQVHQRAALARDGNFEQNLNLDPNLETRDPSRARLFHAPPHVAPSPLSRGTVADPASAMASPFHPFVGNYLAALSAILASGNPAAVALFFDVGTRLSKTTVQLREAVRNAAADEDAEMAAVRAAVDPGDQWSALARMVYAYIVYIRAMSPDMGLAQRFEILLKFLNTVSSAADHNNGAALNALVLNGARHITRLGIIADDLADDGSFKYAEQAHSVVQRLFNVSLKGVRVPNELGKRETSVGVINCLFKLSSKMGRIGSMTTIIVNLHNVLPSITIPTDPRFSIADRCTYAYFTGIEHFQNAQYLQAATSLQASHTLCHPSFLRNRRKILIHLVASNVIIGRFPSRSLYALPEAAQFQDVFSPIVAAMKLGCFAAFERALLRSKKWLAHFGVFHDLEIRCEALLWRNLIKHTFATAGSTTKSGIESVSLDKIHQNAVILRAGLLPRVVGQTQNGVKAFREDLKISSVASVVLGLIDNGWINGYVNLEKGVLAGWSSKARMMTRLADVRNQYVGMLWGGERGSGVTEKDAENKSGNVSVPPAIAAPTFSGPGNFGGFAGFGGGGSGGGGGGNSDRGGYATDTGDDMEMEL